MYSSQPLARYTTEVAARLVYRFNALGVGNLQWAPSPGWATTLFCGKPDPAKPETVRKIQNQEGNIFCKLYIEFKSTDTA